jgi:hypothetical protein
VFLVFVFLLLMLILKSPLVFINQKWG